jgi:hypothetical protein
MAARTLTLGTAEIRDLASVRRELESLLWSRDVWSPQDARAYDELTKLEFLLLSCPVTQT